jgi:hypothetical protein
MTVKNHADVRVCEGNNAVDFSFSEGIGGQPTIYIKQKSTLIAFPAKEFKKAAHIMCAVIDSGLLERG